MWHRRSVFSLSQGAGPLEARARQTPPQQTEQNRESQQQQCLYLLLCLGHTAQCLRACQGGLLSGTVCLWGERCPGVGRERPGGGGKQGPGPHQAASLGAKGRGSGSPWARSQVPPTPLSAGSDDRTWQELPTSHEDPSEPLSSLTQAPQGPQIASQGSLGHPCTPTLAPNPRKLRKLRDTARTCPEGTETARGELGTCFWGDVQSRSARVLEAAGLTLPSSPNHRLSFECPPTQLLHEQLFRQGYV